VSVPRAKKATFESFDDLLRKMLAESGGKLTTAEIHAADRALGLTRQGRPRKARRS
jgi:hypothetical protein